MQKGDITEILKVFEKRITKLEKKVVELGSTVEDLRNTTKTAGESVKDKSVKFKTLDTMFDELSLEKPATTEKVMYDKSALLGIRSIGSNDSENTALTDIERLISMDFLEEGEVYEPPVAPTVPTATVTPLSKPVESPRSDHNRGRHFKEKKIQKPTSNTKQAVGGRERSKSEPMMEKVCKHYVKKQEEKMELPECKSEMHYGLLVQYPPEDGDTK